MPKIKELITFDKIKEVIDIDTITDPKSMVEKYVISTALEEYLVGLLQDFNQGNHKAGQIIGGYGSGKSHLLAFVISILSDPELRQYIPNEKVKAAALALKREFAVVYWELQPNDVDLAEIFYDKVEIQLKANYGIDVTLKTTGNVDHKANVAEILERVKDGNPTRGLIVIIDEISDFLKQKTKEKINRDMQFLRVLGQTAQASDFTFIGAMQEHIFSNSKYVDEAESFGRVSERFQVLTIKREDINRVISRRVLLKTPEQRVQLEQLFKAYIHFYPEIQASLDEYIDLFPLHPYVIKVFSELPYFEKRGVIQFTVQEVERLLDEEFPALITFDAIFDEIESKHTVKNLETVSPVVDAISTLGSKIDLLDRKQQESARCIIKALAVLKLNGKSLNNGATVQELANTLLLLPGNKAIEAADEIELILKRLRKVTDGQFINVNQEGYYYLDLALQIDYDQVIERKTDNLPDGALEAEILAILKDQLGLKEEQGLGIFSDTCIWPVRRSYREGQFIFETGRHDIKEIDKDYQVVMVSPMFHGNRYTPRDNRLVITANLDDNAVALLKRVAAAKQLIIDNFQKSVMDTRYTALRRNFIEAIIQAYLESGQVSWSGNSKPIKSLITREFRNMDELLSEIKPALLEAYFESRYPQHPRFTQQISRDNIRGEFSQAVKDILSRNGIQNVFSNSRSILGALELLDEEGNLCTTRSDVVARIMEEARANPGKSIDVQKFVEKFAAKPYGYDRLMTAFVLVILCFNGEILLKAAGGKTITSADMGEVFGSGLDAFENIRYLMLEGDINPQPLIDLFIALGINPAVAAKLRVSSKRGEAVQDFRTRYLEIKEQCDLVQKGLIKVNMNHGRVVDVAGLKTLQDSLDKIPLDDFDKVKSPADLKKIIYDANKIKLIGEAVVVLGSLFGFYGTFFGQIATELDYALQVKVTMAKYPGVLVIDDIDTWLSDALAILADANKLVKPGELNPLLGKLQQIKKKYHSAYYHLHQQAVGDQVNWSQLEGQIQSQTWQNLKLLQNVEILPRDKFFRVETGIDHVRSLRCLDLRVEQLENRVLCPQCNFPENFGTVDINERIKLLGQRIAEIAGEWETTILIEVNNNKDKLEYLTAAEKKQINALIKAGCLPEIITNDLVKALNHLFQDLEMVQLDGAEFIKYLFKDNPVLDYYGFERRLGEWKHQLVAGVDLEKVRIITGGEEAK